MNDEWLCNVERVAEKTRRQLSSDLALQHLQAHCCSFLADDFAILVHSYCSPHVYDRITQLFAARRLEETHLTLHAQLRPQTSDKTGNHLVNAVEHLAAKEPDNPHRR